MKKSNHVYSNRLMGWNCISPELQLLPTNAGAATGENKVHCHLNFANLRLMRKVKHEFQPGDFIRTGIFVLVFLLVIVAYFVRDGREISIIIPLAIIVGIIWTEMQRRDPRIYYDENNIIVTYRLFIFPMDTKKITIGEINQVSINEKMNSMGEIARSLIFEIADEESPYHLDMGRENISDCRDFLLNIETQNPGVVDQDFLIEIQGRCADF